MVGSSRYVLWAVLPSIGRAELESDILALALENGEMSEPYAVIRIEDIRSKYRTSRWHSCIEMSEPMTSTTAAAGGATAAA